MISIIELVVSLLGSILASATKNKLPAEVVAGIQSALTSLEAVQNTPVTLAQLEGMRVTPEW